MTQSTSSNHGAPTTAGDGLETDLASAVLLNMIPGIGPRIFTHLIDHLESPDAVLRASRSQLLEVPGVGHKLADAILGARDSIDVQGEFERCQQEGIRILCRGREGYPRPLEELPDTPPVLYSRGHWLAVDELAIAIVGTRHASTYGIQQARRLAGGLALAGVTVVSGLARGIDGAAHQAALDSGGRTLAVLGGGLLRLYPPEHESLVAAIAERGAVMSEMPTLTPPRSGSFPQRNRLISGLTRGVVIVEAAQRSGALITARHAMEQNREVFAVPGRVDSRTSGGCHQLLRDGARLVESVDDILDGLGPLPRPAARPGETQLHHPAELKLNDQEQLVLQAIEVEPTSVDHIVAATRLPVHRVLSTLSVLEMRRLIQRVSGTQVRRP